MIIVMLVMLMMMIMMIVMIMMQHLTEGGFDPVSNPTPNEFKP